MNTKKYISLIQDFKPDKATEEKLSNIINSINFLTNKKKLNLVFICTHNSRRSQFSEIWGNILSTYHKKNINVLSAGMIKTEVYFQVIESLKRIGFKITHNKNSYLLQHLNINMNLYSKILSDIKINNFISIMTCSEAEASCPIDLRSKSNLKLLYEDPKIYDNTKNEQKKYDSTCLKIAYELNYIFKNIN